MIRSSLFALALLVHPFDAQGDVPGNLRLGVDLNRDGLIQLDERPLAPSDLTGVETPFVFWINGDQDDLTESETWPVERADSTTAEIDSIKDLEDFHQLMVELPDETRLDDVTFTFDIDPARGSPAVGIFLSADGTCTNQQLLDRDVAGTQLEESYRSRVGLVAPGAPLEMPGAALTGSVSDHRLCLLLEGVRTGSGELRLSMNGPGDSLAGEPFHFEMRDVKSLYQRTRIDWPEEVLAPWMYTDNQPPDPQLQWVPDLQGVKFEPPWYEDEHVIVWVYGWQKEGEEGYLSATVRGGETIFKRLWHRGFRGRLVFLHWPTVKPKFGYGLFQSEYRAYKSGPALKDLVEAQPGDRTIHVTAHSLGNVVLLEALKLGIEPEDAMFQVGAISASSIDPREELVLPEMLSLPSPDTAAEFGYRGYLQQSPTRLYNMYNPTDHTWIGWNLAQHLMKPTHEKGARYRYEEGAPPDERYVLEYRTEDGESWSTRPVSDPHEVMAFIARSKTHPIGGEARLGGPVEHVYDIGRPPYAFAHGHTVGWSWPPQRTTEFFNLLLDAFNIAHKSAHR